MIIDFSLAPGGSFVRSTKDFVERRHLCLLGGEENQGGALWGTSPYPKLDRYPTLNSLIRAEIKSGNI